MTKDYDRYIALHERPLTKPFKLWTDAEFDHFLIRLCKRHNQVYKPRETRESDRQDCDKDV